MDIISLHNFMKKLPSITIVGCTYNPSLWLFEKMLKAIKMQTYPKSMVEHIIMDAGSTNGTIKLAREYGCKVVVRKTDLKNEEQIMASDAFQTAKGKIILVMQIDNIITDKNWMKKMVQPFLENKNVFCTYTERYSYEKDMSAMTRYGALIGANDPIISPYFLDKIEKIIMPQKKYNKGEIIKETKNHYIVRFNKNNLPALGENGQMVLKSVMDKVNKDPKAYIHLDSFARMFDLGYDTVGVVKTSIIHVLNPSIINHVKRRIEIKDIYYDRRRGKRRYLIYDPKSKKDKINLLKYIVFSSTFIIPLYQSIRGYLKIRDRAWFLHPVICFLMLFAYTYSEIGWYIKRKMILNLA